MIRYLSHNEIDKTRWDETISQCGNIYAFSWYLDIVHPDWSALVEGDYETIMPLTGGKKFSVEYLFQPFFVQQLGVFSKQAATCETLNRFLAAIPEKYRFAEIRLNEGNCDIEDLQGIEYHRNIILDLNKDYNAVRSGYHTNTKRNLAKAEHHNLQLADDIKPEQVVSLFRSDRGADLNKWGDREYAVLQCITDEAQRRGNAFLVGVKEEEKLLTAAIFMRTDKRLTFLFSGNSTLGKEKQAMTYMLDQVIRQNASQNLIFDFEGSDNDQLARFYLGFGGREVKYPSLTFNRLPVLGKLALKCWKKAK